MEMASMVYECFIIVQVAECRYYGRTDKNPLDGHLYLTCV